MIPTHATPTAPRQRTGGGWVARPVDQLVREQLAAIDAWHRTRAVGEGSGETEAPSRELRLDLARRREALQREHAALLARAEHHMVDTEVCLGSGRPRVVLAHRNAWFRGRVAERLTEHGLRVVASVEDGADASAAVVVDQPDLLLVEDLLPSVAGREVVECARALAPGTLVAGHGMSADGLAGMVRAGARAVFSRRISPTDVADELWSCLLGERDGLELL